MSVERVKFAERTDRYPTADEVRAEPSVTSAPFTQTFAALSPGETSYVSALGYDAAGNESPLAQASVTADGATPATPWLFLDSGTGQFSDRAGTTAASGTDPLGRWVDANGNGRYAVALNVTGGDDPRPLLNGSGAVDFAQRAAGAYAALQLPDMSAFTEGCILARLKAHNGAATNMLWLMNWDAHQGGNVALYPDSADGHIKDSWGTKDVVDFGDPGVDLGAAYHTYEVHSTAAALSANLDGVELYPPTAPAFPPGFNTNPRLSGSINAEYFDGLCDGLVVFDSIPTDAQLQGWRDYFDGTSPTPPTDSIAAPTLTYAYSGGDVVITASVALADSAKIATSLSATPSEATVRAESSLTVTPFSLTVAAPIGAETLHVAAFAYYGAAESALTTLDIPPEASSSSDSAFVPTWLLSGETFTVPARRQATFAYPIDVDGVLDVYGVLTQVD